MLTLKELKSIPFQMKGKKAYTSESVDIYVESAEKLVEQLYSANSDLEDKMTILADKLEEYISKEDSIKETLLSAQRVRDSIISDAKAQAEEIIEESKKEARETSDDLKRSVQDEQKKFIALQKEVSAFKTKILSLYKEHLESISEVPNIRDEEIELHNISQEEKEDSVGIVDDNPPAYSNDDEDLTFTKSDDEYSGDTESEGFKINF